MLFRSMDGEFPAVPALDFVNPSLIFISRSVASSLSFVKAVVLSMLCMRVLTKL